MYRYGALAVIAFALPLVASAASCPSLSRGSTGPVVSNVQQILFDAYQGFPSPTGYFGPTTEAAVRQWQGEHGIARLGIVGPQTAAAMGIDLCSSRSSAAVPTPQTSFSGSSDATQALIDALLAQIKILQAKLAEMLGQPGVASTTIPIKTIPTVTAVPAANGASAGGIHYINPNVSVPAFAGYPGSPVTLTMPDTLDLAERASYAIHGLTSPTYAAGDYEVLWEPVFNVNPPGIFSAPWESIDTEYWVSLPEMRVVSGSPENIGVDSVWQARILKSLSPSGPLTFDLNKSFLTFADQAQVIASLKSQYQSLPYRDDVYGNSRVLGALGGLYLITGNTTWRVAGEKLIDSLPRFYCQGPGSTYYFQSDYWTDPSAVIAGGTYHRFPSASCVPLTDPVQILNTTGRMIDGPAEFYLATRYTPALDISRGLAHYMIEQSGYFNQSTGAFLRSGSDGTELGSDGPYFANHSQALQSIAEYVVASAASGSVDTQALNFVKSSYEWVKAQPTVNVQLGWFPKYLSPNSGTTEYGVAEMTAVGTLLSVIGAADYWDDVDAWVRNQFQAQQVLSTDWVQGFAAPYKPATGYPNCDASIGGGALCTFTDVPNKVFGSWGGWSRPNDVIYAGGPGILGDSTGRVPHVLFMVWNAMLQKSGSVLSVNLLLNRVSPWATVASYVPYSGRADITVKDGSITALRIRVPGYADKSAVTMTKNGSETTFAWIGNYAIISGVTSGDIISIQFPITNRTITAMLPKAPAQGSGLSQYTITLRGSTATSITPGGQYQPFYTGRNYDQAAPMKSVSRFIFSNTNALVQYPTLAPIAVPPAAPVANPAAGTYTGGLSVTLSSPGATSIHYTADGSTPTCSSGYVYGSNGANYMYIGSTMMLSVVACNSVGASAPVTVSYTIKPKGPCEDGWTLVPGNGRLGTGDFCVMQFQAQNPLGWMEDLKKTGDLTVNTDPNVGSTETTWLASSRILSQRPVSQYSGATKQYAWNYITAPQAATACQSIGAKLMDVPHAQTINLNLAAQPKNWQSGMVGQGCLFGGNMDGHHWDGEEPLAAPHGDDTTADPYEGEVLDAAGIANKTQVCPFPLIANYTLSGLAGYAGRRSFYLSNGGVLWDWSGNLGEWLINILPNNPTDQSPFFSGTTGNGAGYWDLNTADNHDGIYTDWTQSYLADMERPWMGPYDPNVPGLSSGTLGRANGVGGYYGPAKIGFGAYRGGSYYKGQDAGIFHIDIGHPTTFSNVQIGFRCYKDVGSPSAPLFVSKKVTD